MHESEMSDASLRPVEGELKGKPRRNKAGMEVYVPRPKRLQQSAEPEKEKCNSFEEKQSNIFQNVENDKAIAGDSKELKKLKRHKAKVKKASSDSKDRRRKDTPKSKHEKHGRSKQDDCEENKFEAESNDHEKHQEQGEDRNFDSNEHQNNCVNDSDETWEDEMKFYDSINKDGEMDTNVEDKPGANTNEMCLDQPTTAADDQGVKATTLMETIDPSPLEPVALEIMGASKDLSVSDSVETGTVLTEANNQTCDQPVDVETLETDKCSFSKEVVQGAESDSDVNLCFLNRPEAKCEDDHLLSDQTDSEEQPNKRRRSQEEPSGVFDCDGNIYNKPQTEVDNKTQTEVDSNSTRTCDSETAQVEGKIEVENLEQPSETEMVIEKSTSFSTSSDNTKEDINVAKDDSTETETRMDNENVDPNDQMTHEIKVTNNSEDNQISDSCPAEGEDDDTWDALFDDDGEALDPKLMDEVNTSVISKYVCLTRLMYTGSHCSL